MKKPRSRPCFAAALAALLATTAVAADDAPPLVIDTSEAKSLDLSRADGGLMPVPGAHNYGVFRASKAQPGEADGKGYAYHHHPDLAVWRGRYYLAWGSGAKDEDIWPARELYSTSANGRDWAPPAELFPEGVSVPFRLYFFRAPNGRMLVFSGLRVNHERTREDEKGPLVVREIRADHSLGPVYTLRPPTTATVSPPPPLFTTDRDPGFVSACRELLQARLTLETQDYGLLFDPTDRNKWHDAAAWPNGKLGVGFWKAASFYHRADGIVVGVGKAGWTSLSSDEGRTWSQPVIPPTLRTNNAKIWGQRTGDGRYVLVYNPTTRPRHPLALVHGDDGIAFKDMRAVQMRFPAQRYAGINKNTGVQYVRGIAEWASDGSLPDAQRFLWLTYSANKEDIWVTRIPLPVSSSYDAKQWNVYQPKWATVQTSGTGVVFETREPQDSAEATRHFAPASHIALTATVTVPARGLGAFDIELVGGKGGARAVRLRFAGDGFLRGIERDKIVEFGQFEPGREIALHIDANAERGTYTVNIDGKRVDEAQFAERTASIERIVFRASARADSGGSGDYVASWADFLPAISDIGPEFDQPTAPFKVTVTGLKVETK